MFLKSISRMLTWLVGLMVAVIVFAIGWYLWDNLKLRRRAKRMGIDTLPVSDRVRTGTATGFSTMRCCNCSRSTRSSARRI